MKRRSLTFFMLKRYACVQTLVLIKLFCLILYILFEHHKVFERLYDVQKNGFSQRVFHSVIYLLELVLL